MRQQELALAGFPSLDRGVVVLGAHLLDEVRARERLPGGSAIVVQQPVALAGQPTPVPARVAQVHVGKVDDVGIGRGQVRHHAGEEAHLLHEIGVTTGEPAERSRREPGAGQIPRRALAGAGVGPAAAQHLDFHSGSGAHGGRAFAGEGLETALFAAEARARKEHPDGVVAHACFLATSIRMSLARPFQRSQALRSYRASYSK